MEIRIESVEPMRLVGARSKTKMATIGEDIGRLVGEVAQAAAGRASPPAIVRYVTWDGDGGEILLGWRCDDDVPGLESHDLPGGRVVTATHVGAYDGLAAAWGAIHAHVAEHELGSRCPPWEVYENDCTTTPPDELRTRIVWPID